MNDIKSVCGYCDSLVNPRVRRHVSGLEWPPRGDLCSDLVLQRAARRPVLMRTAEGNNDLLIINASIKLCDRIQKRYSKAADT